MRRSISPNLLQVQSVRWTIFWKSCTSHAPQVPPFGRLPSPQTPVQLWTVPRQILQEQFSHQTQPDSQSKLELLHVSISFVCYSKTGLKVKVSNIHNSYYIMLRFNDCILHKMSTLHHIHTECCHILSYLLCHHIEHHCLMSLTWLHCIGPDKSV